MAQLQDSLKMIQALQRWADGKGTLKEVRDYADEELYALARMGFYFFYQGKVAEARTLFQGLFAVNPRDAYFARSLAVVEYAAGNAEGSLSAYDVAIKLAPDDAAGYLGRAEIFLALGRKEMAAEDLKRAAWSPGGDERLRAKATALMNSQRRR